jgi:deoxyribodipyrimidine photo-lyase
MRKAAYWFRDDLRLKANIALNAASQSCDQLVCVVTTDSPKRSGASLRWRMQSIEILRVELKKQGHILVELSGKPVKAIVEFCKKYRLNSLHASASIVPEERKIEQSLVQQLNKLTTVDFKSPELIDYDKALNGQGKPYKVFTPFYNKVCSIFEDVETYFKDVSLPAPLTTQPIAKQLSRQEKSSSNNALNEWHSFFNSRLNEYDINRDCFKRIDTSRLSHFLATGQISVQQILNDLSQNDENFLSSSFSAGFVRQLIWREYARYLMWHFPMTSVLEFKDSFKTFPWRKANKQSLLWQEGKTGYPIVDASMRCLRETGVMHNRLRMVVGSFLTKHLLTDWRVGEKWFAKTLVDYDPANNIMGWQWIAGCGVDAAPYFRVFNPIIQSRRYDSQACFISEHLPELSKLPIKLRHAPFEMGSDTNIEYPQPIVDHQLARSRALSTYKEHREQLV